MASLLAVVLEAKDRHRPGITFDLAQHDALARKAAGESLVLLKNEGKLLPLEIGKTKTIAVIGAFSKIPRYQGAGSSQVNPTRVSTAYDELVRMVGDDTVIRYAAGYDEEGTTTDQLIDEATAAGRRCGRGGRVRRLAGQL